MQVQCTRTAQGQWGRIDGGDPRQLMGVTPVNCTPLPRAMRVHCTRTARGQWGTIDGANPRQLTGVTPVKMGVVRFDLPDWYWNNNMPLLC